MLEVLTIGGAKAVGLDRVTGSLTVGKRADILLIDGLGAGIAPVLDPIGAIMLQASVADIGTVIADGRVQKFAGKLTDPALPQIIEQVKARSAAMVEAARQ